MQGEGGEVEEVGYGGTAGVVETLGGGQVSKLCLVER